MAKYFPLAFGKRPNGSNNGKSSTSKSTTAKRKNNSPNYFDAPKKKLALTLTKNDEPVELDYKDDEEPLLPDKSNDTISSGDEEEEDDNEEDKPENQERQEPFIVPANPQTVST